jgi:jumonji domain-containing protein 2
LRQTASLDLRRHLVIPELPFSKWDGGSLAKTTGKRAPGIHTPYLYVTGTDGPTPFALHVEDFYLYSLNYLHSGAKKLWVVIHPHDSKRLEKHL